MECADIAISFLGDGSAAATPILLSNVHENDLFSCNCILYYHVLDLFMQDCMQN